MHADTPKRTNANRGKSPLKLLVVTPTLGTSPWLEETVRSVAERRISCEHVLVAPRERIAALVERYPNLGVVADPGGGMYAAINAGLASSSGWDAFTYINDDDLLLPGFERVVACVDADEACIAYGGVLLINTEGKRTGAIPMCPFPRLNRLLYAQRVEPVFQHGTIATRKAVEHMGGPFDTTLRFCGDSEFLARGCVSGVRFIHATRRPVAAFRLRAGQATKNLPVMLEEHNRLYAKLRLAAPCLGIKHRLARFVFCLSNTGVYLERIRRHGFLRFGEVLAKVE